MDDDSENDDYEK